MCYTAERGKGASAEMSESNWEQNANAIFLPIPDSLDALRRSTIQKLLAGASASRFVVTHEDDYLPGVLDSILCDPDQLEKLFTKLGKKITGSRYGAYRCAALWDWNRRSGLLIHQESKITLCAFLPLVTVEQARLEKELSLAISQLALRAGDTIVDIGWKPLSGKRKLGDVLKCLAEQIDPG